jgi:hypothetical protein
MLLALQCYCVWKSPCGFSIRWRIPCLRHNDRQQHRSVNNTEWKDAHTRQECQTWIADGETDTDTDTDTHMHLRTHALTRARTHLRTHALTHTDTQTHTHTHTHTRAHPCTHAPMHARTHTHTHTHKDEVSGYLPAQGPSWCSQQTRSRCTG